MFDISAILDCLPVLVSRGYIKDAKQLCNKLNGARKSAERRQKMSEDALSEISEELMPGYCLSTFKTTVPETQRFILSSIRELKQDKQAEEA